MRKVLCSRCLCIGEHNCRGLCRKCAAWAYRHQRQGEFSLTYRSSWETAEEYEHLRDNEYGSAFEAIAERLNMTVGALERALYRAGYRSTTKFGSLHPDGPGRKVFRRG